MTSRDPDDPGTARFLAERAGTVELLKKLTLLTYADISAVKPGLMTSWRLEQLWSVYLIAYRALTRELEDGRITEPDAADSGDQAVSRRLPGALPPDAHARPISQSHVELERRSRERGVAVDIRRDNGFYRLTLVARDRPSLLASIAGALAGFGMNIRKAEGFANRHGTFSTPSSSRIRTDTLELNPTETDRLRVTSSA